VKDEAAAYYAGIGFPNPDSLDEFRSRNGFNSGGDVQAVYFNEGDLRLGREMHCKQNGPRLACYVSNYGPPPFLANPPPGHRNTDWPNTQDALAAAVNGPNGHDQPFATVAMEFSPDPPETDVTAIVHEFDGATTDRFPTSGCLGVGSIITPTGIPGVDVDTGIDIEPGDRLTYLVTGSIWAGFCAIGDTDPNGYGSPDPKYPLPSEPGFSLIGRVGNGPYFFIGDGQQPHTRTDFQTTGRLFLRTNDDIPGNGSGSFGVRIFINRQNVKFYVYDKPENQNKQLFNAALDAEGAKPVPQMCMTCHGGTFKNNRVTGASFLPFELKNLLYSSSPNFTRLAQEENFRQLNQFVASTRSLSDPTDPIFEMIKAMYDGKYDQPGAVAGTFVSFLPGWNSDTQHALLYNQFVRPYCRTCHAAARKEINFGQYDQLLQLGHDMRKTLDLFLCQQAIMPHAEVTYENLGNASFDSSLAVEFRALGLSCVKEVPPPPLVKR
jgi:hypothetical protein